VRRTNAPKMRAAPTTRSAVSASSSDTAALSAAITDDKYRASAASLCANASVVPSNRAPAFLCAAVHSFGSFHTKRCRGGVERRQMELKGVEGGR